MLQQLTSEQWLQPFPFEEWVLYARVPCLPHCPGLATFLPSVFPEWVHRTVTSSTVCQWYDSSLLVRFVSQVARQMGAGIPWSDGFSFCHIYCGARSPHIYIYYEASSRHIYCGASSPHIFIVKLSIVSYWNFCRGSPFIISTFSQGAVCKDREVLW